MPNVLKCALRAQRHDRGGNVDGLAAVLDQADMVEPRAVADRDDQASRGPDRPSRPRRAMKLSTSVAPASLPRRSSERVNIAAGAAPLAT